LPEAPVPPTSENAQDEQSGNSLQGQAVGLAESRRRAWSREDRKNLAVWAVVGFLFPALAPFGLHALFGESGSAFTLHRELPMKLITAFFMVLGTWVVSRREKRPLDDYGIPPRQAFGLRFWEGAFWGFGMLSGILYLLHVAGYFRLDSVALTGTAAIRYALGWGLAFLAVSISEEFAFRGYLLVVAARRIRFWRAAVALSLGFAAAHIPNPGENVIGILQVFVIGMLFCFTIRRTGSLWFALGFHAAWDWAETYFYGTPDSGLLGVGRLLNSSVGGPDWLTGGSAGPEGSVICLLLLLACALLIHYRFPRVRFPDRPV